jgi:molybdopterin biosynthesis enzyme MoaB
MRGAAVITASDRSASGVRADASGPALAALLERIPMRLVPRDVTPEATAPLIERDLPGVALAMRWGSYRTTPFAMISRAIAGFHGDCLIVNMPGSPRAVAECFGILLPTLRQLFGVRAASPRSSAGEGRVRGVRTSPRREQWL